MVEKVVHDLWPPTDHDLAFTPQAVLVICYSWGVNLSLMRLSIKSSLSVHLFIGNNISKASVWFQHEDDSAKPTILPKCP